MLGNTRKKANLNSNHDFYIIVKVKSVYELNDPLGQSLSGFLLQEAIRNISTPS